MQIPFMHHFLLYRSVKALVMFPRHLFSSLFRRKKMPEQSTSYKHDRGVNEAHSLVGDEKFGYRWVFWTY